MRIAWSSILNVNRLQLLLVLAMSTAYTFLLSSEIRGSARVPFSVTAFMLATSVGKLALAWIFHWGSGRRGLLGSGGGGSGSGHGGSLGSGSGLGLGGIDPGEGNPVGGLAVPLTLSSFLPYAGTALLYAINDCMVFLVLTYFDSVAYSVLVTGKVAIVALLTRFVLRRRLTDVQYTSFVVLFVGVFLNQYPFCNNGSATDEPVSTTGYLVVCAAEVRCGWGMY